MVIIHTVRRVIAKLHHNRYLDRRGERVPRIQPLPPAVPGEQRAAVAQLRLRETPQDLRPGGRVKEIPKDPADRHLEYHATFVFFANRPFSKRNQTKPNEVFREKGSNAQKKS